jgi:phosphoribosylformylglycinamidine cyclo-ligase
MKDNKKKGKRQSDYFKEVISPGDSVSALAKKICQESLQNTQALVAMERARGSFRGAVKINWAKHILRQMLKDKMYMLPQNDGAGHKPGCFTLLSDPKHFFFLGWEIIEMCFEDIVRDGGLPVAMLANQIDFKRITKENFPLIKALLDGYSLALKKLNASNITGETAAMKMAITTFCDSGNPSELILTWTGTALGLGHVEKELDGSKIKVGMPIVGLHDTGAGCNGYTKLIELGMAYWKNWRTNLEARNYFQLLCVPSANYSKTITRVHGWLPDGRIKKSDVDIAGIAHITGGGVWGKLGEILPKGVGADLHNMPEPPQVLKLAQGMSRCVGGKITTIKDIDAYGDFHGGCRMLVIVKTDMDAISLVNEARRDGIAASIVGATKYSKINEIRIDSRFMERRILSSKELEE